jgi:hypothetical protein
MSKLLTPGEEEILQLRLRRDDIRFRVQDGFAGRPLGQGVSSNRAQSYDHCFNYFTDTPNLEDDIEKSCAVLGFYLASWGMFRGSSYLLSSTNSSDLQSVVRYIQRHRARLSAIDLDSYTDENIEAVREAYGGIKDALTLGKHRPIVLVTKIMAGVFGCVPAFDRNFCQGFRSVLGDHAKLPTERLTANSLQLLRAFYRANQKDIDDLREESRTVAFDGNVVMNRHLKNAKIVDMYCFDLGEQPGRKLQNETS